MGENLPRVVIVAPDSELEFVRAGVESVVNCGLPVSLIGGEVTLARLTEWDWSGIEPGGILYVASEAHGVDLEDGVAVSDGVLSVENLVPLVRAGRFAAVYLNTVSSARMGLALSEECGVTVIATVGRVPTPAAYQTSVRFFRHLYESGGDFLAAFQHAKPGHNRSFVYLEPDMNQATGRSQSAVTPDDLRLAVTSINRALLGDEFTPGGLVGQIRRLQGAVETFSTLDRKHQIENERRWRELEDSLGDRIDTLSARVSQLSTELEDIRKRRFIAPERFLGGALLAGLPVVIGIAVYLAIVLSRAGG